MWESNSGVQRQGAVAHASPSSAEQAAALGHQKATLQKVSKAESPLTQFLLMHIFQKAVCLGVTKPPKILQQADTHHHLELCLQGTTHPLVNGSLVPFMLANVAQQLFVEPTFESA